MSAKNQSLNWLIIVASSLIIGGIHIFVSMFSSIVPVLHFVIIWGFWLAISAHLSWRPILVISPIVAFLLYWVPSPNYWRDLVELDLLAMWSDFKHFTGFQNHPSPDVLFLIVRNGLYFSIVLISAIGSARSVRQIRGKNTNLPEL